MITIKMTEHSIRMTGHAGTHSESGADRACAAVSALTCNLVNSLHDLTQDKIRAELSSGDADIRWDRLSEQGKLLMDSWFLGITEVNREYNCIQFQ
jgi:uncharacterized protein